MATLADTIKAALDANWSVGAEPTYIHTGTNVGPVVSIAEYIQFIEREQDKDFQPYTLGYDTLVQDLIIETSTRTDEDRLDAITAEIRSITLGLMPATYDFVHISRVDKTATPKHLLKYTARMTIKVTTYGVAR